MRLRHALLTIPLAVLPVVVATPAHALTCPMLVDPVGDGGHFAAPTLVNSGQVDIVSADVASGATNVVAVLRVASLDPDVVSNLGLSWALGWSINGNRYTAQVRRTAGLDATYVSTFNGAGANPPFSVAIDVVNDTITWTIPRTGLPDLVTPGATFTQLAATTTILSSTADVAISTATYVDQTAGCIPAS